MAQQRRERVRTVHTSQRQHQFIRSALAVIWFDHTSLHYYYYYCYEIIKIRIILILYSVKRLVPLQRIGEKKHLSKLATIIWKEKICHWSIHSWWIIIINFIILSNRYRNDDKVNVHFKANELVDNLTSSAWSDQWKYNHMKYIH